MSLEEKIMGKMVKFQHPMSRIQIERALPKFTPLEIKDALAELQAMGAVNQVILPGLYQINPFYVPEVSNG